MLRWPHMPGARYVGQGRYGRLLVSWMLPAPPSRCGHTAATTHHKVPDGPVEDGAIVILLLAELDEVFTGFWCLQNIPTLYEAQQLLAEA